MLKYVLKTGCMTHIQRLRCTMFVCRQVMYQHSQWRHCWQRHFKPKQPVSQLKFIMLWDMTCTQILSHPTPIHTCARRYHLLDSSSAQIHMGARKWLLPPDPVTLALRSGHIFSNCTLSYFGPGKKRPCKQTSVDMCHPSIRWIRSRIRRRQTLEDRKSELRTRTQP